MTTEGVALPSTDAVASSQALSRVRSLLRPSANPLLDAIDVSAANARLYYVACGAQAQRHAVWTGRKLRHTPQTVIDHACGERRRTSNQYG